MTRLQPLASAKAPCTNTTVFCGICWAAAAAESMTRMKESLNMFVFSCGGDCTGGSGPVEEARQLHCQVGQERATAASRARRRRGTPAANGRNPPWSDVRQTPYDLCRR